MVQKGGWGAATSLNAELKLQKCRYLNTHLKKLSFLKGTWQMYDTHAARSRGGGGRGVESLHAYIRAAPLQQSTAVSSGCVAERCL